MTYKLDILRYLCIFVLPYKWYLVTVRALSTVVAALYGVSESRPTSSVFRHSQILSCLRRGLEGETEPSWASIHSSLRRGGFDTEALQLMDSRRLTRAEGLLERHALVTSACEAYPQRLLKTLGRNAPPVLWMSEPDMAINPPWQDELGRSRLGVGGVGCRQPLELGLRLARGAGAWCADRGCFGVSGAAAGCDSAFAEGVLSEDGDIVHCLPCGMDHGRYRGYAISVCPPAEPFSAWRAMERNRLIYALANFTLVCSARFRIGGSWQGATSAIRSHHAVAVIDWTLRSSYAAPLDDHGDHLQRGTHLCAQRALTNLGAYQLRVNPASWEAELPLALDEAMTWACEVQAGVVSGGLFATAR